MCHDLSLKFVGHRFSLHGAFKSVDWINHPVSVVIAVPKSLAALPPRPFKADVTFTLQEGDGEPFATLDPITIEFSDFGNQVVAEIPFKQRLGVPLSDSLVRWNKPDATFRVGATLNYQRELRELAPVRVSGPLGNEIELTIAP